MTRKSERSNLGKTPDYLKDYSLATDESTSESDSSNTLSFHDILNSTIMPNDDKSEQEQSLKDVLLQLTEQMKLMQAEITELKGTPSTPKPLTPTPPAAANQEFGHFSGGNPNTNSQEFVHSSGLNANANTFEMFQVYRKPIVDLPTFDGTLTRWPKFYKTYLNTTAQYRYSDLDNLGRLEKALMGKAKKSVESMLIVPETVQAAIDQLKFLYGDEEKLVKSQIAELRSFPQIQDHKLQQLVDFSTEVRNLRAFIVGSECEKYLSNPLLLDELLKKLSLQKQIEWMKYTDTLAIEPTLTDFSDWISQAAKYASKVSDAAPVTPTQKVEKRVQKNQTFHAKEKPTPVNPVSTKVATCFCCKKNHRLIECDEFSKLSINEKWTIVKQNNLCFACLRKGHPLRFCHSKKLCPVEKCDLYHHILLHSEEERSSEKDVKEPVCTNKAMNPSKVLFKVLPITLHANNRSIDTFAFIDEGSSATLIDEELADQLELQGSKDSLTLQWLNDQEITQESKRVMLEISERGSSKKLTLQNVQTVKGISLPMQSLDISKLNHKYQAIRSLPIQKYDRAVPKILIGLNNIHVTFHSQQRLCSEEGPIAVHTKLGWLVYGTVKDTEGQSVVYNNVVRVLTVKEVDNWDYINNQMNEYFSTEGFGCIPKKIVQSKNDERAEMILHATTKKTGSRYETGLLWRQDDIQLPDSKSTAVRRLQMVERRMHKDEEYARLYKDNMNHFIEKGYAKKLSAEEASKTSSRTWYLPHFGVKNPAKPNKLRLVFDAASKVNNISLNDLLLTGPDLYENLLAILFRFRQGKFAVCADVREMFLQIRITESDQESQRFLWRDGNQSVEPEVYKMVSMIFGAKCSPASAQYVKNHHADKFSSEYPVAARSMKSSHYMDDYIQSFDSIQETIEVSQQVVEIHGTAGFELRNFISNSTQVAKHFENTSSKNDVHQPTEVCESLRKTDKILGMHWDSTADELLFELKFYKVDQRIIDGDRFPTKRELLSIAMSIYDPFGFLGNFTIYVKLLLQDMWRLSIDWDERIPSQFEEKWINWLQELHQVKHFRIPRCYCPSIPEADHIELHVLVDASERAFSAVAYFRVVFKDEKLPARISFVSSKSRCAPLKYMTVPRKELQGAVLGARLKSAIIESHTFEISRVIYWSDSKTVISWIKSDHRRYKPFVANRVSEILDHSEVSDWRWVPSAMNVADDATRDVDPPKFESTARWIFGPEWLIDENDWPTEEIIQETTEEKRVAESVLLTSLIKPLDLSKFSTYNRVQRVVSWIMRWVNKVKHPSCQKSSDSKKGGINRVLTARELAEGEKALCRWSQRESFADEMKRLENGECIKNTSKILNLTPYLDDDGLIKVNGRTDNAMVLPIFTRRPIILDKDHALTKLIVQHYHMTVKHLNEDTVICEIRRKFWINGLRQAVRQAKTTCMQCKMDQAKPVPQLMGQLPIDRLTPHVRAFTFTGLDYFGPINITVGRRTEKRWVALFTCLTVRAVHVEIARDLSADQCILCIRNFINTRGVPSRIRSDNGTNLVGAKNELINAAVLFNDDRVRSEAENRGIEWRFICPANPAEGGCWERMVQSIKRVLRKILKTVAPREETLRSFLLEAANIVNSHPLTHVPVSCFDEEPLTPNHFILGEASGIQGPGPMDEKIWTLRKQWRVAQQLKNHFWSRWIVEYLPFLTRRTKWYKLEKPIQIGDLVIICDNNMVRNEWRRGIVSKLFPDKKNVVRTVEVSTSTGVLKRPVSKLAVLDVRSECPPPEDITVGGNVDEKI